MAPPPAPPRYEAPIQSREELPELDRPTPVQDAPLLSGEVELVGTVEPRRGTPPGWNPAPLLDALVEMHNPMMETRDGSG
jgi:hypothetical protein